MEVKKVRLVYFSPTGTTRTVLKSIAKGMAVDDVESIDLTLPEAARMVIPPFSDELVVLGAPVYGGRVPVDAIRRFECLDAHHTLAVLVVVYGNRDFEDALLELRDQAVARGFHPVAGGTFIGEHSFATDDAPIAHGRPDAKDIRKAMEFGARIKDRISALASPQSLSELDVPGRFPYEGGAQSLGVSPQTEEDLCDACGICADVCPTAAITVDGIAATEVKLCIRCCACIKSCPTKARAWEDSTMKEITTWLNERCRTRREPQLFGIEV